MAQKVQLKRSSVVTNGAPKLPTTSQVEVGELTINFAEGYETLSTKNSNNNIATFSSDAVLDRKYISSGAVVSAISAVSQTIEDNEYVIAQTFNDQNDRIEALEGAGFLTGYTETDPTVPAWAKASTKPTYTAAEVGALSTATTYFDDVEYDSNTKRINFKKNNSVIDYVDATAFIKDGMVSSVTVSNGNLVVSFNTDAGKEDITLALTQIFNPSNYYDKTTADGKFLSLSGGTMSDNAEIKIGDTVTLSEYGTDYNYVDGYVSVDAGGITMADQMNNKGASLTYDRMILSTYSAIQGSQVGTHYMDGQIIKKPSANSNIVYTFPDSSGTLALTSDIPTEASIISSGFGKSVIVFYDISPATYDLNGIKAALPSGFYTSVYADINNGKINDSKTIIAIMAYMLSIND